MRLTNDEIKAIKKVYNEIFKGGEVYLFGSRVDDSKKGGDIDLYLVPNENFDNKQEKRLIF